MIKKHLFISLIVLLVALGIFFYIKNTDRSSDNPSGGVLIDRQKVMTDVAEKIGDISPVKSVLGGSWYVNRFWFVEDGDENFYVEYEDGHIFRQVLLNVEKTKDELNYKVIGYFEPGETTWILKKGEDLFFGKGLDLYEYDEESSRWVKKN